MSQTKPTIVYLQDFHYLVERFEYALKKLHPDIDLEIYHDAKGAEELQKRLGEGFHPLMICLDEHLSDGFKGSSIISNLHSLYTGPLIAMSQTDRPKQLQMGCHEECDPYEPEKILGGFLESLREETK